MFGHSTTPSNLKRFWLLVLCVIYFQYGYAQEPQAVVAIAKYHLTQVTDTTNRSKLFHEQWVLYLGENSAMFHSYDKLVRDSILLGEIRSNSRPGSGVGTRRVSGTAFYFFADGNKHFRKEQLLNNYVFPLDPPDYRWKIYPETRNISGLNCQKATGYWKGRTYTVWFTPDLPFRYGPWNMHGLPGLIVEAIDSKQEIKFEFAGFEKNTNVEKMIAFPEQGLVMVSEKEFQELKQLSHDDPIAFVKTTTGAILTPMGPVNPNRKSSFNNPIELDYK